MRFTTVNILFIFALLLITTFVISDKIQCNQLNFPCDDMKTCRDCIRAHPCCVWCYQKNFTGDRCFLKNKENKCDSTFLEYNLPTTLNIVAEPNFSDVGTDINEAVQLRPHEVNVDLRYGESVNISVKYRPAKDYPLQLYYLMDLTLSMQPDLDTLRTLGTKLTSLLKNLTKHHSIAFGSYIDKPAMPFADTAFNSVDNPCQKNNQKCGKVYLFKHSLNFTDDVGIFIEKVNKNKVSANLDDPEGGMEAIMQILVCDKKLGWKENSRKLILLATEGTLHFGGDGILAGFIKKNTKLCNIGLDGNYISKNHFDYPSIEELYYQLKKSKTNIIVASKSNNLDFYEQMEMLVPDIMFVGELKPQSSNILELVKKGYYEFIRQVNLFPSKEIDGLNIEFFADCDRNGTWVKTSSCTNAEEGKEIEFRVQLMLEEYQNNFSAEFTIEESNIQEKIKIQVNFVDSICKCPLLPNTPKTCEHGMINCGQCLCEDGWSGDSCSVECKNNISKCRFEGPDKQLSLTCSGQGECICSKCHCKSNRFQGEFCQYECPYDRNVKKICSGHGKCMLGNCMCDKDYIGESCGCHNSTENCQIPGTYSICNSKGRCLCNRCKCDKGYRGHYCEQCDDCALNLCNTYQRYVIEHVINQNPLNGTVRVEIHKDLSDEVACVYQYDLKKKKCRILYNYRTENAGSVLVTATEPNCSTPMAAAVVVWSIIGAFLAMALLIAIFWKGRNMYRDRREFLEHQKNLRNTKHSEQNPLYKDPIVKYTNPMSSGTAEILFNSKVDEQKKMR